MPMVTISMRNIIALSAILLVCVAGYYFFHVGSGQLRLTDEYHTLDRTLSIGTHGEWLAVYTENQVSFKKPPLQYWISAIALDMGVPQLTALRLPSLVAALLLLPLIAILTEQLVRRSPFTVFFAPLFLAGSEHFWRSAMSALLDQGSVLFATSALVGSFLALRNPKWWYLVAVMCGLSALQ
ncbi:MAG: glycosyltransferase family 39 protein, partial [Pseudomonadota bacterium]